MDAEPVNLAADFPPVTHHQWRVAVDAALRGGDFDQLRSLTADGIVIDPLYTSADASAPEPFPAVGGSRRGSRPAGLTGGWDVRQRHALSTPARTNSAILADLQRGVTSIELVTDHIEDFPTLDAVLANVLLDIAPVGLISGDDGVDAARRFLELASGRGVDPSLLVADLGCDPVGQLASTGQLNGSPEQALERVGSFATDHAVSYPAVRFARADGTPYAEAGASPATELAAIVATALEYVRAMVGAGLEEATAFERVLLATSVGTDQFGDIAKLRALRVMWARVLEVSGFPEGGLTIQARTGAHTAALRDPWTNMLRVTISCFAACTGGADIITVHPFDTALGVPSELGLRIARNTQLVLMEESHLNHVIDPAGGSWFVEEFTDQLADKAWEIMQQLEREGGVVGALREGSLQRRIEHTWAKTKQAIGSGELPIIGVTRFPDSDESPLARDPYPESVERAVENGFEALPLRRLGDDVVDASAGESTP